MSEQTIPTEEIQRLKGLGFITNKGTNRFSARVITVNGRLTAHQLRFLADAAETFGEGIVFTTRLTAEIIGIPYERIEEFTAFLEKEGMETGGTGARVRPVVCCKGTTCRFGLLDSYGISEEIHRRFYKGYHHVPLPHKFKIAVGGCPNNCVKPSLNDVGIMGWKGGYKIFIGGRWGKKQSVGQPLHRVIESADELYDIIEKCILLFKEQGLPGERFCDTISRLGFDNVEALLLADDLLARKAEIIG